jgi:hypothetical protein
MAMIVVSIDEGQRQLILMSLAHLAVERPGFDYALREIALLIDNPPDGEMFQDFKVLHAEAQLGADAESGRTIKARKKA